jgi:stage III sporulation protein AE
MKKLLSFLIVLAFSMYLLSLCTYAIENTDIESIQQEIENELNSAIDGNVRDVLEDIGFDGFDLESVYNVSLNSISSFFSKTLKEKIQKSFSSFFELLSVILLTGIITSVFTGKNKEEFIGIFSMVIVALIALNSISSTLSAVISVLSAGEKYMLSFIPVYTLIISLSGNPASALTYNTLVMGFAEVISYFITMGVTDFLGVFYCLGISFSFNDSINISRIISSVNKIFTIIFGFSASLFTGFLSIKSILSASVDSLSVKGIRFLIGSMIPIVGSSISEAYSSFLGSINLIKGSVAFVGIIVIVIINIPIIFETIVYYASFSMLSYVAESVSANKAGDILKCFSCGMRILLLVCIFEMFIMIISTGVMLSVKSGG